MKVIPSMQALEVPRVPFSLDLAKPDEGPPIRDPKLEARQRGADLLVLSEIAAIFGRPP
jgi:hypothetical protein